MQISRRFLFACAVIAILLPKLNAADTEAQRKAREALSRKMQELGQPASTPEPATAPSTATAPTVAPSTVTPAPARVAPASSVSKANQEKALQALREAMKSGAPTATETPVTSAPAQAQPAVKTEAPKAQPPAMAETGVPTAASAETRANQEKALQALRETMKAQPASADEQFQPVPQTSEADLEKLRQALRDKTREIEQAEAAAQPAPAPAVKESAKPEVAAAKPAVESTSKPETKPEPAVRAARKGQPAWTPLQGPPTGLSPEKEQRLKALLDVYRADKLTPAQYHAERAKILAEP